MHDESPRITRDQAEALERSISSSLRYLTKLQERLDIGGFPRQCEYSRAVQRAHDAMHALWVHTHYLTIEHGVGKRSDTL